MVLYIFLLKNIKKGRLETWARFSKDKGIAPPTDEEIKKDYDKFYRRK